MQTRLCSGEFLGGFGCVPGRSPGLRPAESGVWDPAGAEGGGGQRTSGPSNCWPVWAASGSAGMGLPALLQASGPATAGSRPWVEPTDSGQLGPAVRNHSVRCFWPLGPVTPGRAAGREGLSEPIRTPGQASGGMRCHCWGCWDELQEADQETASLPVPRGKADPLPDQDGLFVSVTTRSRGSTNSLWELW